MSDKTRLTVMQLNDIHGYYNLHPEMFIEHGEESYRKAGGYSRIATLLKDAREKNPNGTLIFDNGDTFHGTHPVVDTKGEMLVPILNKLQIEAMTAHWDFAYGPKHLEHLMNALNYPMLATNIYSKETNELIFEPYKIIERVGVKIGVIGLAEHIVDKMMPPHFSKGIYFTLGVEEVKKAVNHLRNEKEVDIIILLTHFGFPQDVKLAEETDGVNIILSSHTHNALKDPVKINETIIIQSGCHGAHIGKLDIEIADKKIVSYDHQLIEVKENIEKNEDIQALIDEAVDPYEKSMSEIIGYTDTNLHRYSQLEATMDNLLLQSLLDVTDAEVAFSNGWRYGAPIPKGPITLNDVWNVIPTNPPVSTVSMSGREILDMLEENLENTFSGDPYQQMGGYVKRCLGIKMFVKLENPKGLRIHEAYIQGERINEETEYDVAFVTVQGVPEKYGKNRKHLDIKAVDALANYIKKSETVSAELRGTIQVI